MDFLNYFLPKIEHIGIFGYWIVLFASLGEALPFVGLIIPGAILVGLFGFFSAQGYFDIRGLIWFSAIGAILGDSISYYFGTKGTKFFRQENKILRLSHLEKGKQFFKKHGEKSIFLGRFISPLRPIIPFVAGLFQMDKKVFLFWNIISGILWAISFLLLGYFFGGALNAIEVWSNRVGLFVLAIVVSVIVIRIFLKYAPPFFAFLKSIFLSIKEALVANPDIKNFIAKHPILSKFVSNRLNKNRFSGLPLTLFGIAFMYVLFLFFGVVEDILTSNVIILTDTRNANLLFAFRNSELIKIFTWITLLGKWQIVISLAIVSSVILWLWEKKLYLIPFWITIAGSEFFCSLGKLAFHRARPDVAFYIENTFSFPSGHATISIAFYGFLTYILFRRFKKWKYKINALFFGIVVILAIGLSRLYLGVHFFSDVWSGYLLGALWLLIGITISEWLHHRKPSTSFIASRKVKIFTASLIFTQVIFYVNFALRYNPPIAHQEAPSIVIVTDALNAFADKNISRFTETLTGNKQEPLSFIVVAESDQKFFEAMQKAGWYKADPATFASVAKLANSAILNENYPTAPMTPSFWNAKVHDFGFEKETPAKNVKERHHARFWKTNLRTKDGGRVYVGTVSLDIGIKWLITHKIAPDIDTEREFLFSNLEKAGVILNFDKKKFVEPTLGENFLGDQFFTDGQVYVINL